MWWCEFNVCELCWVCCVWSICMDESWEELIEVRVDMDRLLLLILSKEFGWLVMDISRGDEERVWSGLI